MKFLFQARFISGRGYPLDTYLTKYRVEWINDLIWQTQTGKASYKEFFTAIIPFIVNTDTTYDYLG